MVLVTPTLRTGRADCEPSEALRPYITSKHEVHPNSVGDGQELVTFFQARTKDTLHLNLTQAKLHG